MKPHLHTVRGCKRCPFSTELYDACGHPKSTAANNLAVSGLSNRQLMKGAKPSTCPLIDRPIVVQLEAPR
jgi:hypothetical protein